MDGSDHAAIEPLDENDPMYVAEEDADPRSYVLSSSDVADELRHSGAAPTSYDASNDKAVYGPMLTLSEFKIRVSDAVREYFDSSDADEVVRCIDEMKCRDYHAEVIKRAISLGLDAGPRERELISRLLACLHPNPLTDEEMELGFEVLLDSIDDLVIDIPDAKVRIFDSFCIIAHIQQSLVLTCVPLIRLPWERPWWEASLLVQLLTRSWRLPSYPIGIIPTLEIVSLKRL